jgi:CheY-like chemotaxis protein
VDVRARILVIDDERAILNAFRRALGRRHDVVVASGGAKALELLASDTAFDVVLCDLMMPETDGIEVHEALCRDAPKLAERMVFCTGGAFTARAEAFIARIDNPCLDKPLEMARLQALIAEMCG